MSEHRTSSATIDGYGVQGGLGSRYGLWGLGTLGLGGGRLFVDFRPNTDYSGKKCEDV